MHSCGHVAILPVGGNIISSAGNAQCACVKEKMAKPSEKDKRYDRQLRLWGDHGQRTLESAHVCLINATSTGTEILKNLVLPGIGAFTILDSHSVTSRDLGANFFVTSDKVGTPRGSCCAELLSELNTEVHSNVCTETLETVLESSPDYFDQFTIVIATGLASTQLDKLAVLLWGRGIPLIIARTYGLLGYIRLVTQSHEVIESHPDNYFEDLRLDVPFNALQNYVDGIDIDALDNTKHSNLPYVVVLLKYLEKWKSCHEGTIPKNYREKKQFKEMIQSGIRTNEDGVPLEEDNFDEAIKSVNSVLVPTKIPSNVQELIDDSCCLNLSEDSNNFWLLVRALRDFISSEGNGLLPVRGSIPDMTSSSDLYIELQHIYLNKAKADIDSLTVFLNHILASVGKPHDTVSESEIKLFCRNSAFLRFIRTRSLSEELIAPNIEELMTHLSDPESNSIYYILLRAADRFYSQFKTYPGMDDQTLESDIGQLKSFVSSLIQEWGLTDCQVPDENVIEFCRYGGGELHSIASYIGGVTSQEVIKIITHQYVPINNTYIYNGSNSTSLTMTV